MLQEQIARERGQVQHAFLQQGADLLAQGEQQAEQVGNQAAEREEAMRQGAAAQQIQAVEPMRQQLEAACIAQ